MREMLLRDIYDVMYMYALRNQNNVRGDEDSCYVGFSAYVGGTTYAVAMKTEYFGTVNHIEFTFPQRVPASRIKEASRVANELNCSIRFGAFRLVEHNGMVRYCFDTVLKHSRVTTDYFAELMDLSVRTVEAYAPRLLALCE